MSETTAFDTHVDEDKIFTPRAVVTTVGGQTYTVSQKLSTVVRYAREARAAETEVKKAFFVTLNVGLTERIAIAADQIALIEEI